MCDENNNRMEFHNITVFWRGWGLNVDMLAGGGEEVGAGAVGRCCVLVWCLAGGCVVAWIGGGCGPF